MSENDEDAKSYVCLEFPLKNQLSPEPEQLLEKLYWTERIFEISVSIRSDAEYTHELKILMLNYISGNVWKQINDQISEENAGSI